MPRIIRPFGAVATTLAIERVPTAKRRIAPEDDEVLSFQRNRAVTNTVPRAFLLITAVLVLGACGGEQPDEASSDRSSAAPNGTSAGRGDGVAEASGTQDASGDMMARMELHLHEMMAAAPDSVTSLVPTHRQMTANMVAQANREMQMMNMSADSAWIAIVDSLRTDLTRMPEMSGAELESFMPGHHGRVMRLMEAHREMMMGPEP